MGRARHGLQPFARSRPRTANTPLKLPPPPRPAWAASELHPVQVRACEYRAAARELRYQPGSLLVLAGPSGVGKSTFSARLLPASAVLSSDAMRERLSGDASNQDVSAQAFELLAKVTRQRLADGRTTLVDSLALHYYARNDLVWLAQAAGVSAHLILLDGSRELCLEGQASRERQVAVEAVDGHLRDLAELKVRIAARQLGEEGFASVVVLDRAQAQAVQAITAR